MSRLAIILGATLLAGTALSQDRTPAPAGAEVYIITPRDGQKIHGPVTVRFGLKGAGIAPAGIKFDNTGHHHLLIDSDLGDIKIDAPLPSSRRSCISGRARPKPRSTSAPANTRWNCCWRTINTFPSTRRCIRRRSPSPWTDAVGERAILHVDMDAFYASVEERDRPELKGKPLIVGGTGGRGVVAAASYAVRRYGVHSAMPMATALRLCPDAVCLQPRMARYKEVSCQVFHIFRDFTPIVEGLSLDEAFLDVSGSERLLGGGEAIAKAIRRAFGRRRASRPRSGIGPNKLLAKIASDLNKPDGLCRLGRDNVHAILDPLPIRKLFGVGQSRCPASRPRAFIPSGTCGTPLTMSCGARSGSTAGRCAIAQRASMTGRSSRIGEEKSISAGGDLFAADLRDCDNSRGNYASRGPHHRAPALAWAAAGAVIVKIRRQDFTTYTRQRGPHTARPRNRRDSRDRPAVAQGWVRPIPVLQCDCSASVWAICRSAPSRSVFGGAAADPGSMRPWTGFATVSAPACSRVPACCRRRRRRSVARRGTVLSLLSSRQPCTPASSGSAKSLSRSHRTRATFT